MHISNPNGLRNIPRIALQVTWSSQSEIFSPILSRSLSFYSECAPYWFQRETFLCNGRTNQRSTIFFLSFSIPYENSLSLSLSLALYLLFAKDTFLLTIFQRLVRCEAKTPMGLLGSYEKFVCVKIFYLS